MVVYCDGYGELVEYAKSGALAFALHPFFPPSFPPSLPPSLPPYLYHPLTYTLASAHLLPTSFPGALPPSLLPCKTR